MIYSIYKYSFYRFYVYGLKKWGERSYPQYWAAFVVATLLTLNALSIAVLLEVFFAVKAFSAFGHIRKWQREILILTFYFLNYYFLASGGKYKKIKIEFDNDKRMKSESKRQSLILGIYVLTTTIGFFICMWIAIAY